MSYSDVVQAAVNNAHDTAIANKIIDMMRNLKLKNDDKTACRWIWELIQNAKDVVGQDETVNIEIDFNERDKYLAFRHDGKSFTTDNIVSLISQVSSKERKQSSENNMTGKFGTGFLTTHLLSEKVLVSACLQDNDEPLKKISILLDRSGETKEEVIAAVNESFRQLKESQEADALSIVNSKGFNTCFLYELQNAGIEIAKNGLESLYVSIPYVFAFVEKINSIKVNDSFYVERGEKKVSGNMEAHSLHITEKGCRKTVKIVLYREENIQLAVSVEVRDKEVFIVRYPENMPKIFCDFPLIGTEDFSFPVVINSAQFNPDEPRSGIFLTDKDNKIIDENKNLMKQALWAYKGLLDYVSEKKWNHLYNIVRVPKQQAKDWLSKEWVDKIVEECRQHIKSLEIINTASGEKKALFDFLDDQDVFIIGDRDETTREYVWELASLIYPERMVINSEIHEWYNSLWKECRNFNIQELINRLEKFENLKNLELRLGDRCDAIAWLNRLYTVLIQTKNVSVFHNAIIFPNQYGQFCSLNELFIDDGIDEIYKRILELLDVRCRSYLLEKRIDLPDDIQFKIFDYKKLFEEILEALDGDAFSKREAMAQIIVLYDEQSKRDIEQIELLNLLKRLFAEHIPEDCEVKSVNEDISEKARRYWCTEMADAVSGFGYVSVLEKELKLNDGEDVWVWLKQFIEYLNKYKYKNLFERKTKPILPNQNGEFITMESLFLDSGEIDDVFKDIMCEEHEDIRSILLPIDIYFELPESRVKGLKDVVQVVTDYVKNNQGLSKKQDDNVKGNFTRLFCWINDNSEKAYNFFREIVENKHWLYDDEEIAQNMKKAERYDELMNKYNIHDQSMLEKALLAYSSENVGDIDNIEISEELMVQYGIGSIEEFEKAKELDVFKENFVHVSESDRGKFEYVKSILERARKAVFKHLASLSEYDVSSPIEVSNTIFIIKKHDKEIVLIIRPSDYGQVILYYGAERDILDYEKEYELWVEDGREKPQQITFGKVLKLTGINRIPLRKVK